MKVWGRRVRKTLKNIKWEHLEHCTCHWALGSANLEKKTA